MQKLADAFKEFLASVGLNPEAHDALAVLALLLILVCILLSGVSFGDGDDGY